jgi:DNA-binding PucR family transcriptional regulator
VALEALASTDPARVRDFLEHELAPLERGAPTRAPLLDTMHTYFQCDQNAAETARKLGVHERTIAYRLNLIEQRLGTPIASRRAELELALRLQQLAPPG